MGARVYIPILGRFAQVDPIEGGTDNNYVYPTDPVNDFDLDGTFSIRKFFKDNWKAIVVGAAITGFCGATAGLGCAIAAGAAAGAAVGGGSSIAHQLKTSGKVNLGKTFADTLRGGVGGAASGATGFGASKVLGKLAFNSKTVGIASKYFGNAASKFAQFGGVGGRLNNPGLLKIGWSFGRYGSTSTGRAVFRLGIGRAGGQKTIAGVHYNILRGPKFSW